ncbi:MAG TPA: amino acid adenylation domain-containing protein, partial [Thermoanaerobaculia bacterium]|nr:amino acid adenylation domain-containing protein [Thermoanaerobaculia bacterium]
GSPIAGRNRLETERLIGLFVNTLVLRGDVAGDPELKTLLGRVRETVLNAHAHQDLPFEKLVQELRPERSLSHTPLFQVALVLQNTARAELRPAELVLEPFGAGSDDTARFDLALVLAESPEGISGALEYSTDLFDPPTVARLAAHLETLLSGAAEAPDGRISMLPLLSEAEHLQVLEWNATDRDLPGGGLCVHELFEAQARRTPEAVALIDGTREVLYRDLDQMAGRLAGFLRRSGAGPEAVVGLCLDRSAEMVAALLAILKAGAAYVPLDPLYPRERLAFMLEDAGISVVVTTEALRHSLPDHRARTVLLDAEAARIEAEDAAGPGVPVAPGSLAYVLYTSGSTGRPKGVQVPHSALTNFLLSMLEWPGMGPGDILVAVTPLTFDIAGLELYLPLLAGGRVVIASRDEARDGLRLQALLADSGATLLQGTPSTWRLLLESGWQGDRRLKALCGGEALAPELADRILERAGELWNLYGPTETTVWSTVEAVVPGRRISIGKPIANTQAYVVDPDGQPVPAGIPGELLLGGAGLARGYLHRPDLTAERFLPDPFADAPGARLYRTGDLARWTVAGDLEILGRLDHQVKVRGFRIELGEIEAALVALPGVREAAVVAREDTPGDRRLVAYFAAAGDSAPSIDEPRRLLASVLPEHMIPSAFVILPALPLTPNGKVDRRSLPAPAVPQEAEAPPAAPRSPVEEIVGSIWAEVLSLPRVGPRQSFFDLGGHSLLATRVASRVRAALGVEMPLRALFEAPTLGEFSHAVERSMRRAEGPQAPPLEPAPRTGPLPLSFAQERLWFLEQLEPGRSTYNIPVAARLRGPLHPLLFARSLEETVRRHEVLRTTFRAEDGVPNQVVTVEASVPLPLVDLSGLPAPVREGLARALAREEAGRPFDLARGPLLRARLLRLDPEDHVVLVVIHHIVSDGWSLGILVGEIASHYTSQKGLASALQALPIQYADYAIWQRQWLRGEVLEAELEHWRGRLEGAPPVLQLPADRPRPPVRSGRSASLSRLWPASLVEAIGALARREAATPFMVLLSAVQVLLTRYTGQEDISLGTPIAGRGRLETERLIGLFVNILVLRTDVSGDPGFRELLRRNREVVLDAHAHQDLPFEKLVEDLRPERSLSHTPLFQVMLVLQNTPRGDLQSGDLAVQQFGLAAASTPFDLTFTFTNNAGGIALSLENATDLFDEATVARLAVHLERLLAGATAAQDLCLSAVPLLTEAEEGQLRSEWNEVDETPGVLCLHELVRAQAERMPEAVAVEGSETFLTYGELVRRARRLGCELRAAGVGAESRVGLAVARSPELIVGLLAILEAGGAYLPLDPGLPPERLALMLEDSGASVLLTEERWLERLPADRCSRVILLEKWDDGDLGLEVPDIGSAAPENTAYVLYTSGSTGLPKGVAVEHRSAAGYAGRASCLFGIVPGDRMLQFASIGFDTSVEEIFSTFAGGGTLVLRSDGATSSIAHFLAELARREISVLDLPTAYWHELVAALEAEELELPACLRLVIIGGEEARADRLVAWQRRAGRVRLINGYGPTETTVVATFGDLTDLEPGSEVPIGKPVQGAHVHVVGRWQELLPPGAIGEILIGGAGVARGYLGRPDLTAERFIPDPFSGAAGGRVYRTGDLARRRSDGDLVFCGRRDRQVKVRGYRVELEEVEAVLRRHPGVRDAAVLTSDPGAGDLRLAGYYVPADPAAGPSAEELRKFLGLHLPVPMAPSVLVRLESMPLTSSGKTDRRALLAVPLQSEPEAFGAAPRDLIELRLARIWEELLDLPSVGVRSSFFDLGGHSLVAMRLVARIRREFGQELPVAALFGSPTVEKVAGLLRARVPGARRPALVEIRRGSAELAPFFCVHPIGGNVLCYVELARALGPEQPFYGLQTPGRAERGEPWSIPAMAAHYLEAMRTVQPAGPYHLGGWSLGGVVAFEMARQLRDEGEAVELAALIDPPSPRRSTDPEEEPLVPFAMDLGALLGLSPAAVRDFVAGLGSLEEILAALQAAGLSDLLPPDLGLAELGELFDLYGANHRALRSWGPEASPGEFLVLYAEGGAKRADEWSRMALGGADLQEVEGDHYSILRTEGAGELARHLTEALRRGRKR